jgi:hypothetical protein
LCCVRKFLNKCTETPNVDLQTFSLFLSDFQIIFLQYNHAVQEVYIYLMTGEEVLVEPKRVRPSGTKA